MTCIVALKDKEYLYIGGDRFKSNSYSGRNELQSKIFKKQDMLLGYSGFVRFGQIIEKYLELPIDTREINIDYVIMDLIPAIRKILEEYKYSSTDHNGSITGLLLICYKGSIFQIQQNYSVLEYEDYDSIGSGEDYAEGALYCLFNTYTELSPENKIKLAIGAASFHVVSVDDKHIDILKVKI